MTDNKSEKKPEFKTKIGGQALIEGIMMKGPDKEAMAVRKKDGEIFLEVNDLPPQKWYNKTPFFRGVCNFVGQMKSGYSYMMRSADISGAFDEESEEDEEAEEKEKDGKKSETSDVSESEQSTVFTEGQGRTESPCRPPQGAESPRSGQPEKE